MPFSTFLQRHHWPKWLAIVVAELGIVLVIGGLLFLVVTQVYSGFDDLSRQTVESYDDLKTWLLEGPLHLTETDINQYAQQALAAVQQDSGMLVSGALSVGSTVGHVLTGVLLTLFSTLFILIDGPNIWRWVVRLFPHRARGAVDGAGRAGWVTLTNFVKVQILVAFVDAVGIGLGSFFLGVPLAIPIGVLVFLGSFVPVIGAVVTGALAVFIALVYNGPVIALILLIVVLGVQQLEGHPPAADHGLRRQGAPARRRPRGRRRFDRRGHRGRLLRGPRGRDPQRHGQLRRERSLALADPNPRESCRRACRLAASSDRP